MGSKKKAAKGATTEGASSLALATVAVPPTDVGPEVRRAMAYVLRETRLRWFAPLLAWLLTPGLRRARAQLGAQLDESVNWISDSHLEARFRGTESVLSDSWCVALCPDLSARTASERGALLLTSAFLLHDFVAMGGVPQEYEGTFPLDMAQYQRLFSFGLRPAEGDLPARAQGAHVLVIARGRFYMLDVLDGSERRTPESWRDALDAIIEHSAEPRKDDDDVTDGPLGATAGDRPQWRALATSLAETNAETLAAINDAIFTMCLDVDDEFDLDDLDAFGRHAFSHGFKNRWYDHTIQLVVSGTGDAAVIGCFRAGLEGRVAGLFCIYLATRAVETELQPRVPGAKKRSDQVHELTWSLDDDEERATAEIVKTVEERLTDDGNRWWVPGLSLATFKKLGVKPDAGFHLALHVALRDPEVVAAHGRGIVREMIDMRRYRGGHVRTFIPPTSPAEAFHKAWQRGASDDELRALVLEASRVHGEAITCEKELRDDSGRASELVMVLARGTSSWAKALLALVFGYGLRAPGTFPVMSSNIRYANLCELHGPLGYVATSRLLQVYVILSAGPTLLTFQTGRGLEGVPAKLIPAIQKVGVRLGELAASGAKSAKSATSAKKA
jgi:hypothetical protein